MTHGASEMATKYHIGFDTKDTPGVLKSVTVKLGVVYTRDRNARFNIALMDHPLYEQLEHYVLNNPSAKRRASNGT